MKNKRLKTATYIIFLNLLVLCSCKNKEANEISSQKDIQNEKIKFRFDFPDTVYVNQSYNGKIIYEGILDTIITTFGDKEKNRYIRYIMTMTDSVNYDEKYLKMIAKDSFGAINNRTIPFYDVRFTKTGVHYIDGIINDNVYIDTVSKPSKPDYLIRYIENEVRATHKVYVIEKAGNVSN